MPSGYAISLVWGNSDLAFSPIINHRRVFWVWALAINYLEASFNSNVKSDNIYISSLNCNSHDQLCNMLSDVQSIYFWIRMFLIIPIEIQL